MKRAYCSCYLSVGTIDGRASRAPVADAAQRGDLAAVRTLLRDGADVNAAQGDGMTALHWSALNGQLEIMNVLLYAGRDDGAVDARRPIHAAPSREFARAGGGGLASARGRQQAGCDDGNWCAAAPFGRAGRQSGAVKALLDRGADVNARDDDARTDAAGVRGLAESARGDEGPDREGRGRAPRDERHRLSGTLSRRQPGAPGPRSHRLCDRRDARPIRISISTIRRPRARPGAAAPAPAAAVGARAAARCRSRRRGRPGRRGAGRSAAARRTSNRSAVRADSPRCTTRRVTGTPTRRCCCSKRA